MLICDIGRRMRRDDMERCENEGTYHLVVVDGPMVDLCPEHFKILEDAMIAAGHPFSVHSDP